MKTRREFFKTAAAAGLLGSAGLPATLLAQAPSPVAEPRDDRRYWISVLDRLATPVLKNLSQRELKKNMPVEAGRPADRRKFTHLEAFGRLLAGIAPWLELQGLSGDEAGLQKQFIEQAHSGFDAATDAASPDFMNFTDGGQPLVDAAFLAQGILRAPRALWATLEPRVQKQIVAALKSSRGIGNPTDSNWVMFSATVEAALLHIGEPTVEDRLEGSVRRMLGWYKGDGAYGDGEWFHFDYYNSFVIQPMLIDVLDVLRAKDPRFEPTHAIVLQRARRYAEIQERLIAPDGSFPVIGRSITYRFGAFQVLAQIALLRELSPALAPAQVRAALTAVIRKTIEASGTFDERGWLQLGLCGHQPMLAESYISTGSLYLCSVGLLPLGLPPSDPFWSEPPASWTAQRVWSGQSVPADHALRDTRNLRVPTLERTGAGGP